MYTRSKILGMFVKAVLHYTMTFLIAVWIFSLFSGLASKPVYKVTFICLSLFFALLLCLNLIIELVRQGKRWTEERRFTLQRNTSHLINAVNKIKKLKLEMTPGNEDQFRSFLGKVLNALDAGLSFDQINEILSRFNLGIFVDQRFTFGQGGTDSSSGYIRLGVYDEGQEKRYIGFLKVY